MSSSIDLIIGLGNPGPEYETTRHNAGFWFIDELANQANVTFKREARFNAYACQSTFDGQRVWLLKPNTFMNHSGKAVSIAVRYYKIPIDNILVVYDEIDLEPGVARIKHGGGHGGHNGMRDIISALGGDAEFTRIRIGVGHPGNSDQVVDYVLNKPSKQQQQQIQTAINEALSVMPMLLKGEQEKAMTQLHTNTNVGD